MDARLVRRLGESRLEPREQSLLAALVAGERLSAADALRALDGARSGGLRDWLAAEQLVDAEVLDEAVASIPGPESDATRVHAAPAASPERAPAARADQEDRVRGTRVGLAVLERPLGAGGMGEVWLARHVDSARPVAVKFLTVESREAARRFLREIALVARLRHPSIPTMLESGEHAGQAFVTMEYVEGGSLQGATLTRRETAQVLRDAADALAYAHEEGVIHRDVKPANLIRTPGGKTWLIDFGVARAVEEATRLTATGTVIGTPNFMAPEQALGRKADHRSDLYALAATGYALLVGRPPIVGSALVQVIRLVASTTPEPLAEEDDLARIVNHAMAHEREDRYPSARALLEDLDAYLGGRELPSRRAPGLLGRLKRWLGPGPPR